MNVEVDKNLKKFESKSEDQKESFWIRLKKYFEKIIRSEKLEKIQMNEQLDHSLMTFETDINSQKLKQEIASSQLSHLEKTVNKRLEARVKAPEIQDTSSIPYEISDKTKKELDKIDTQAESQFVIKYKNLQDRDMDVAHIIEQNADKVLHEVQDWKQEKSLVARTLLKMVNKIISTER